MPISEPQFEQTSTFALLILHLKTSSPPSLADNVLIAPFIDKFVPLSWKAESDERLSKEFMSEKVKSPLFLSLSLVVALLFGTGGGDVTLT